VQLLIERRAVLQQGWFRAFADGPLKDKVSLSEEQTARLERVRERLHKELLELSRDLEDQCVSTLRNVVPTEGRKRLISIKELVGCRELPGAPEVLVSKRQ